ncbi:MAG: CRISPR-associated ring nuclease [Spirochaetes bacterium]|nr:CRISPR-associated ring nuclease [Spirochaetota bacterium]
MRIGICSLGQNWLILPEVLGFLDPSRFDFYQNHPERESIEGMRRQYGIEGIDELWVVTTTDEKAVLAYESNVKWIQNLPHPPIIRGWACGGIPDLNTPEQCRKVRNLIHLVVLAAHRQARKGENGTVLISLAGGRKTISADLQDAAIYFGCDLLFHIVDRGLENHRDLRDLSWEFLSTPLPREKANVFIPVRIAQYPFLDTTILDREFSPYRLDLSDPFQLLQVQTDTQLIDTIEKQTKQAFFFFENLLTHSSTLIKDRRNFFYLFTLNPAIVRWMRTHTIQGTESMDSSSYRFLQSLPKAELHCHLGGVLDVPQIFQVAELLMKEVKQSKNYTPTLRNFLNTVQRNVKRKDLLALRTQFDALSYARKTKISSLLLVPHYLQTAIFVLAFQEDPALLEEVLYGEYLNPEKFVGIGIQTYERLGDLQGSALLQTEATIRLAVSIAVQKAAAENVRYLELRCSPWNYTEGELKDGFVVYRIIAEALKSAIQEVYAHPLRAGILLIASRHRKMSEVYQYIELMKEIYTRKEHADLLLGLDLAGDEKQASPQRLREAFLEVMNWCPYITIHAGETENARSVWEAVYHLNAERIGHGLTLKEDSELMRKVIDRGIALEMCPSSNHQIVGFTSQEYPLKKYLDEGARVTVNTDNPGISRTNLTKEYLQAARLTPGGLSILEIFQLIKNGFSAAFLPLGERERLLLEIEQELSTRTLPLLLEEVWRR